MLIFLIGMMGSGKSTIGQLLSEELGLSYFDTDDIISSLEGKSIAEIFEHKGENYFRNLEKELIHNWKLSDGVVATGGGLPCHNENIDVLNQKGKTIYLVTSVDQLAKRVFDVQTRPLLVGKTINEIKNTISDLLKSRKIYYDRAKIKVKTEPSPDDCMRRIVRKLYT